MTLDEKVGQMVQAERGHVAPDDVRKHFLGSVLSGPGSYPGGSTAAEWARMVDAFHEAARATRLGIPLAYGADAVHGHSNVVGATVFPHRVGLGCTHDPALVEAISRATAVEVAGTGVDWTFGPVVAAARDPRWGRTYETFSDRPELAGLLGAAEVRGFQGPRLGLGEPSVMACAKHFAGDGATAFGTSTKAREGGLLDRGDVRLEDADFRRLAVAPYQAAIEAGVASIMVSYSSLRGTNMHASRRWITDVLKGELGFRGLVISDWSGLRELPGSYRDQVVTSVNAGIDVTMEVDAPGSWRAFLDAVLDAARSGAVPMTRIDDAVRRVLTVKCEAGLFDERGPTGRAAMARVGAPEHRALARRAAAASFVLLQNEGMLLPLPRTARLLVAGTGAHSPARQVGGWTISWQGPDRPFPVVTVLDGLRAATGDPSHVTFAPDGASSGRDRGAHDVAVLVASEPSYAEWVGDSRDLALPAADVAALDRLRGSGLPVVVVLLSGRPLVVEPHLAKARAWLAAWLPGSEGAAVADVLFGDVAPTGKLARAWPRRVADLPVHVADEIENPLFPFGYGLTYGPTP
jgi:beta-glucosidase